MISYEPLFKTLEKKKMTLTDLRKETGVSSVTIAKLKKYQSMTLSMIEKICVALNCNIEDVVEISNEYMYYI